MNKKNFLAIALALPILLMGAGCASQTSTSTPASSGANGTVVVSLTDTAIDMGNITGVTLTENKIEFHSATSGWVTASEDTRTFNLLELKSKQELAFVASTSLAAGNYDKIRVSVVEILVTTKDGATVAAKLPSNKITIKTTINVEAGATTSVNLDVLADVSLHLTGNGTYIFTPVIKIETRNRASVTVGVANRVHLEKGERASETTEGMDIDGEMKSNFKFGTDHKFDIDGEGRIRVTSTLGEGRTKVKIVVPGKVELE
ncbi:MAG: DUF4382 domain-containing protein [Candidatus Magasanikbacteria bacterium]|nr:DUF4382 domain-containing protein [Candidatus Magasanikbacteria bacterium]